MTRLPPQIIFTVTNDLTYDQRMQRICGTMAKAGYSVLLVGRELQGSKPLDEQVYRQLRLKCRFNKGKLFYAEYNWLLTKFLSGEVEKLIQNQPSIAICAIDLDTILPCLRVSKKYKLPRVYDAHELFTELTEVKRRAIVYKIWKGIEGSAVPQFQHGYSVNQFIVDELKRRYKVEYEVIRNLPRRKDDREEMTDDEGEMTEDRGQMTDIRTGNSTNPISNSFRDLIPNSTLPIPTTPFFLYQGAVNEGRSFETLIPAMQTVNASLVIAGDGNFFEQAKELATAFKVEKKVIFLGYIKPAELKFLTPGAFAGITLFANTGLNQYYSLANRFFDYINAGIPQLCVDYPEYAAINKEHETALLTNDLSPEGISNALNKLLEDTVLYKRLKDNCAAAANELCWEKEEEKLLNFWNAVLPINLLVSNKNEIRNTGSPDRHLHIICLDVPYPVDYGGVFDLFYKIKSLSEAGIKIHLHCFEYGRGRQPELDKYCAEVKYYSRLKGYKGFSSSIPYIVGSRANKELLKNLLQDDHPILMEGMHCTYFLHNGDLPGNRCFVRLHNVEYQYYRQLGVTTSSFLKKFYYNFESRLLKKYEASLANKATFWPVTDKDMRLFVEEFGYKTIDYLPLFLPEYKTEWNSEKGNYCLYHGNLSVSENEEAATWLVENVFSEIKLPFVIAGKNPSPELKSLAHLYKHIRIVANPDEQEMQELIKKAQVHVLPSMNSTGIKLKLINALYNGRHCLVNMAGVEGSGLIECCVIADSKKDMQEAVLVLYDKVFSSDTYEKRIEKLQTVFNNQTNAHQIIKYIFGDV